MSVQPSPASALEAYDWSKAGLEAPERWPRALHTAMLFCLAWPGAALAVVGARPTVICNPTAQRRFNVAIATPLEEASDALGPEIMELVAHGLGGGVGRSQFRARQYLVAPLVIEGERVSGALLLCAGSSAVAQDHAHHVRNLLARLRSIAAHSAESAESVEDYAAHLDGRISAAGRAQTSSALGGDIPADLEAMVRDELLLQAAKPDEDYKVEGPEVDVPVHATEVLVLALHELATNAVKFGAFSQRNAFLTVTWRLDQRREGPWLILEWSEAGVTMEAPPRREGFGAMLIRQRLPYELKGETSLEFRPGGVHAVLAFPLRLAEAQSQHH
jgi:two-component sensor histidine kinase